MCAIGSGSALTLIWSTVWMKNASANDVTRSVSIDAPRSGRNAIRSIATAASVVARSVAGTTRIQLTSWWSIVHMT